MTACLDCGHPAGPLCPACTHVAHTFGLTADERIAMLRGQPSLFDSDADSDATELTQQWWGVQPDDPHIPILGPYRTREGAERCLEVNHEQHDMTGCESSDVRAWWPACTDYERSV